MLGTVTRQFEIASYLLKEYGKYFYQLEYITPEKLLRDSNDRLSKLLSEIGYTFNGQRKLVVIANLDIFLRTYPECKEQLLLVFRALMLPHGVELLNLKHGRNYQKPTIILGMTEAFYKEHFSEHSDVGFMV